MMKNTSHFRKHWMRGSVVLLLILAALAGCKATPTPDLTDPELRTLNSLEKVDDHPLYTMHYYLPYQNPPEQTQTTDKTPLLIVEREGMPDWGCSLFAALGDKASMLYGRNFDWEHSPAVLLFTHPTGGTEDEPADGPFYDSVTMVDIAYLGFKGAAAGKLEELSLEERRPLLDAPYWPFDGMNERGLVIGMAAVPDTVMPSSSDKPIIGSLGIMREMLDHAATVDEAVDILRQYDVSMEGGPTIHYLLADAGGEAILVEFAKGAIALYRNLEPWHLATNFLYAGTSNPNGKCPRYDTLSERLSTTEGQLNTTQALDLLAEVSQSSTQWSVVYSINSGEIDVVMGRDGTRHTFSLTPDASKP